MEPVGGAENIDADRATLRCEVCAKPKGTGSCISATSGTARRRTTRCARRSAGALHGDPVEHERGRMRVQELLPEALQVQAGAAGRAARTRRARGDSEDEPTDESEDEEPPPNKTKRARLWRWRPRPKPERAGAVAPRRARGAGRRNRSATSRRPRRPREGEQPSVSSPRKAGVVANGGVSASPRTNPRPGPLPEHCARARAPADVWAEPGSTDREERARGRGARKRLLTSQVRGVRVLLGKASAARPAAPLKCARRRENEKEKASSSDLRMDGAREAGTSVGRRVVAPAGGGS